MTRTWKEVWLLFSSDDLMENFVMEDCLGNLTLIPFIVTDVGGIFVFSYLTPYVWIGVTLKRGLISLYRDSVLYGTPFPHYLFRSFSLQDVCVFLQEDSHLRILEFFLLQKVDTSVSVFIRSNFIDLTFRRRHTLITEVIKKKSVVKMYSRL